MSLSQRLRSLLPGGQYASANSASAQQRHSVSLEPEIGFQISIELNQHQQQQSASNSAVSNSNGGGFSDHQQAKQKPPTVPELNVHLLAARHLPALFGFKVVQGYLIKVKLFPGSKRLDSSIQTNSWPKFNENFKFPLTVDIKPSLKHSTRRGSKTVSEFTPEELFAGQFVVFTVYALLELPPTSFNRFNKTYRSLRDKSTNLMQKVVEGSNGKAKDDKENAVNAAQMMVGDANTQKVKRKSGDVNPRDAIPPLTISEARRNIGAVTCYLDPKIFSRNTRTGVYSTEELWLPIKDITTTVAKNPSNNLANATKGVVEIALEVRDLSENAKEATSNGNDDQQQWSTTPTTPITTSPPSTPAPLTAAAAATFNSTSSIATNTSTASTNTTTNKNPQWNRMTSEVKRKMGISNISAKAHAQHELQLRITTARMRCSNKVKDELEATAGSVYVKTTVFEHGIYVDSWKSANFYPSLSTKWDVGEAATLSIPLQNVSDLENILIRTTLATKTKMGKKIVLGTVLVGVAAPGSGAEHMQKLLRGETPMDERVPMWHSYQ